jgi:hypothetical protein
VVDRFSLASLVGELRMDGIIVKANGVSEYCFDPSGHSTRAGKFDRR